MKKAMLFLILMTLSVLSFSDVNTDNINVNAENRKDFPKEIKNITVVTEPTGMGEKPNAIVIEFSKPVSNSKLSKNTFNIVTSLFVKASKDSPITEKQINRTIEKIYSTDKLTKNVTSSAARNGRYIIIQLSKTDDMSKAASKNFDLSSLTASITQNSDIFFTNGKSFNSNGATLKNNLFKRLVTEDFKQLAFYDEKTGRTLKYNLYIPKNYNPNKKYPLVLFMHDAGPLSDNVQATLMQGNGATSWAAPEFQKKHESFVLAPQYSEQVVNDNHEYTPDLDATKNLLDYITSKYSINTKRLYTTGQSMGGMMSLVLNSKYPDLFAASYYVACQWEPSALAPASKNKAWITVSMGDTKAYPGMNAITKVFEENGGVVGREENWNGSSTTAEFNALVNNLIKNSPDSNVKYSAIATGTLPNLPEGNKGGEHVTTWTVAYNIDAIKHWIFQQSK